MQALGILDSDKVFENGIFGTYFLTMWPTYATDLNQFNNLARKTQ